MIHGLPQFIDPLVDRTNLSQNKQTGSFCTHTSIFNRLLEGKNSKHPELILRIVVCFEIVAIKAPLMENEILKLATTLVHVCSAVLNDLNHFGV